jgi:hypothetical protein
MSARRAPDSGPDLNGNFGVFFLMNLYTAISTYIYTPVSFTKVFGKEAVWIMERPTESSPAVGIFGPRDSFRRFSADLEKCPSSGSARTLFQFIPALL